MPSNYYDYVANPIYPPIATRNPEPLRITANTTYARLSNSLIPAFKASILNAGSVDVSLSLDGTTLDRTIPAGAEYEWSQPPGMFPFDLSQFWVKTGSSTAAIKVIYR